MHAALTATVRTPDYTKATDKAVKAASGHRSGKQPSEKCAHNIVLHSGSVLLVTSSCMIEARDLIHAGKGVRSKLKIVTAAPSPSKTPDVVALEFNSDGSLKKGE